MDTGLYIFLVGSVGALAPELVRLYGLATGGKQVVWSPGFYIPISVLFAALGGLIAVILPSENLQSAFYAGVSTPVLISTALKKIRGTPMTGDTNSATQTKAAGPAPEQRRLSRVDAFLQGL